MKELLEELVRRQLELLDWDFAYAEAEEFLARVEKVLAEETARVA